MATEYFEAAPEMEGLEWESGEWESEAAEAARRRRAATRPPRRYARPPQGKGFVTQAQFQTALDKVRADMANNTKAIASVGTQVDALSKRARAELKSLRTELNRGRDETRNTLQTLAILPLLSSGGTALVPAAPPATGNVTVATPPDSLTQLLPLLLLSGSFGGMGGSGTSGGMDSGLMLAVALIAASGHLGH